MESHQEMLKQLRIKRTGGHPRSRAIGWWWLLAVLLLVGGFWFYRGNAPLPVETAVARAAADAGPVSLLDASGFVTARRIATVSAKITGKVREVFIEEGQQVQEGQILASLDDADAQAALHLSEAQHRAAQAQLAEIRANLDLARRDLARQQDLVRQQLTSQQSLDNADTNVKALSARIASQQAQVEVTSKSIAVTRQQLDNTIVRAPFAGVITVKAAQPGEMISPISAGGGSIRTGIGTLVDMDSLEIQVDVNEAYIGRVTPGMPVQAVLNAYPEWKIPGRLLAIIPTADRSKATVKVRIAIDSKDRRIVPDMGVRVSFLETPVAGAAKPTGVWIPAAAVITADKQSAVFIVGNGDEAKRIAVTLAEKRDADQRVEGALKSGARVIIDPPAGLADGRRVQLKPAAR